MHTRTRAFRSTLLVPALALLAGAGCTPTGAHFSPQTGVLTVYGTGGADVLVVKAASGLIVVNGGQMPIQGGVPTVANTHRIELRGREGVDYLALDESGGPLPDALLLGGPGADVLIGGSGDDEADGGGDDDVVLLGDGDDVVDWNDGGGLDTVEGEDGFDTLRFHGTAAAENVDVAAVSGRVRFSRNVDAVTTDLGGVEAIEFFAAGGTDAVVVNDLAGTELTQLRVDLGAPDGSPDAITLSGTQGDDGVDVAGSAVGVVVSGLQPSLQVLHPEPADHLFLNLLGGADRVDATGTAADGIPLVVNGGLGIDEFHGGEEDDLFAGGDGNDVAFLGGGDDTFVWNPGDDNDTVEGEDGFDTLLFNGANIGETIGVSAVGGRVQFSRSIASVVTDLGTVEAIDFIARGGSDFITVNDLSTTGVLEVDLDLAASTGGADATPDGVVVNGTAGGDTVQVFGDASQVSVVGLAADVNITSPDAALDGLTVQTFGGDDLVHAAALTTPSLTLTADGGEDDDVLIGGDGADILLGGNGDDVLQGGPGVDVLDGGPGQNIVIQ